MSAPGDDEELIESYRRASAAEAGRPSDALRAAVLAQARAAAAPAAATRRPRAANDARFAWRMVAGLAVVGVALMVWRQLPPAATARLAAEAPQVPAPAQMQLPPATVEEPAPTVAAPPSPLPPQTQARTAALSAQAAKASPPIVVDLEVRQPVPESADVARESFAPSPAALVRREFPSLFDDPAPPAGVWIVQDATGRTLRTGTLGAGESLGAVTARLQREWPARRLMPFQTGNIRTARGATVLVGIARAE